MVHIEDSQQHVEFKDGLELNGVWFLLQISVLNGSTIVVIIVIFGKAWYPRSKMAYNMIAD